MTILQLYRISGLGLLIGAVVFFAHIVLRSLVTAGVDPALVARQGLWVPINALGLLGAAANVAVSLLSNLGPVLLLTALGYLSSRMESDAT
jgi:hypothetical protein